MLSLNARLTALENRPGNRIPHFIIETEDSTRKTAHGFELLRLAGVKTVYYNPAQPCASEVLALFAALHPDVDIYAENKTF